MSLTFHKISLKLQDLDLQGDKIKEFYFLLRKHILLPCTFIS